MTADIDALNYPYIHIRSVDWLKRTLLVFPHVVRMVPEHFETFDVPEIKEFCRTEGRRGPLLRTANIFARPIIDAQTKLIKEIERDLKKDSKNFLKKFGKQAANRVRNEGDQGFQIHARKVTGHLGDFLFESELAWHADRGHNHGWGYIELHPQIGEAVIATLAFACAENEGLQIVTEFPELHGRVIGQTEKSVFRACLDGSSRIDEDTDEQAIQFLVYRRCDPNKLSAERLAALNQEWEALASFRDALQKAATRIPRQIKDKTIREKYLNDVVSDIYKKWEADRANLSNYVAELFGDGVLSQPGKLLEKVAEKALTPMTAGGGAGILGSLTLGALTGAAAGFAVGLVTYAATGWTKLERKERESSFRYLTMLERSGVSFLVGK